MKELILSADASQHRNNALKMKVAMTEHLPSTATRDEVVRDFLYTKDDGGDLAAVMAYQPQKLGERNEMRVTNAKDVMDAVTQS
jgi:hypothetical protein